MKHCTSVEKTHEERASRGVPSGDWFGEFVAYLVFGLFMMPLLWHLSAAVNEPWAYTMRGVAMMLWPCQWAFWLGKKAATASSPNTVHEPTPAEPQ